MSRAEAFKSNVSGRRSFFYVTYGICRRACPSAFAASNRCAPLGSRTICGNAVAAWVARVDETAVRFTQNVGILLRRIGFAAAKAALERDGFVYRYVAGMDNFLDSADAKPRDAVHIVFAGGKVRTHEALPYPDVADSEQADQFRILSLGALVQIKLTAFRDKDRVHLRDLLDVELIDDSWVTRYRPDLASRLKQLIDNPSG